MHPHRQRTAHRASAVGSDRDPAAHLDKLKSVSESIFAHHARLKGQIPPRLEHFLSGCSYDKALAFLQEM